jgi:trk system potassium uptake protein TrkA
VIIVGGGLAGTNLAHELALVGHAVTLIDRDAMVAERGFAEHGIATIVGDGTNPRVLRDADAGRADVVAAMLRHDAENLAVAAIARQLGARRVLARFRDPAYRPLLARIGVDQAFGEVETMVGALTIAIEHPRVRHSMVLGKGDSIAFEIVVPEGAAVAGMTLRDLGSSSAFPRGAVIAGIAPPEGPVIVPRGDARIRGGEAVLLVSRREDVASAIDFLTRLER